jgi:arabinofuranosyltransferase
MNKSCPRPENAIIGIISIGFAIWSAAFIYGSSFIAIDGKRYFCLFDDAMISMRYAWNFSHGAGLVWNPGEYVQGYTNLLMTLLMSLATLVFDKSTAALSIQISGVVFMLGIAYATMRIAGHFIQHESPRHQTLIRVFAFLCPLLYYPLAYWSLMGMETGLLTLLCLLGVLAALDYTQDSNPKFLLSVAICFGLAFLTRNDSAIFAMLAWLYIADDTWRKNPDRKNIARLLPAIGVYALFIIGQALFQYAYYGELLPNTYFLKLTGMSLAERIDNGIGFVMPFLVGAAFILAAASLYTFAGFSRKKLLLLSVLFAALGYQVYVGGDPWQYWRILSPAMPLLFILFICAIASAVHALANTAAVRGYLTRNPELPGRHAGEVLVILLILLGLLLANAKFLYQMALLSKPFQVHGNRVNVNAAIAINQLTMNDATVGVLWAGTIPYFTGRRAFDFLGKCDSYIARLPPDVSGKIGWNGMNSVPGHNKYDLNYSIKTLQPTYVQQLDWGSQDLTEWAKGKYVKIAFVGGSLFLLKGSPAVSWEKLNFGSSQPEN